MTKTIVRQYCKTARELRYDKVVPDVIKRIKAATSESEIEHIMIHCRHLL